MHFDIRKAVVDAVNVLPPDVPFVAVHARIAEMSGRTRTIRWAAAVATIVLMVMLLIGGDTNVSQTAYKILNAHAKQVPTPLASATPVLKRSSNKARSLEYRLLTHPYPSSSRPSA